MKMSLGLWLLCAFAGIVSFAMGASSEVITTWCAAAVIIAVVINLHEDR